MKNNSGTQLRTWKEQSKDASFLNFLSPRLCKNTIEPIVNILQILQFPFLRFLCDGPNLEISEFENSVGEQVAVLRVKAIGKIIDFDIERHMIHQKRLRNGSEDNFV